MSNEEVRRRCPECGSFSISSDFDRDIGKWYFCLDCDHTWSEQQAATPPPAEPGRPRTSPRSEAMNDVKQAAERLRLHESGEGMYPFDGGVLQRGDVDTLAAAYLRDNPSDDGEQLDIDWLIGIGAKWSTDGTALALKVVDAGPEIVCGVNRRSGEDYVGSLGLYWCYHGSSPRVSLSYLIENDPTKGDVRRLAQALGIELTERKAKP